MPDSINNSQSLTSLNATQLDVSVSNRALDIAFWNNREFEQTCITHSLWKTMLGLRVSPDISDDGIANLNAGTGETVFNLGGINSNASKLMVKSTVDINGTQIGKFAWKDLIVNSNGSSQYISGAIYGTPLAPSVQVTEMWNESIIPNNCLRQIVIEYDPTFATKQASLLGQNGIYGADLDPSIVNSETYDNLNIYRKNFRDQILCKELDFYLFNSITVSSKHAENYDGQWVQRFDRRDINKYADVADTNAYLALALQGITQQFTTDAFNYKNAVGGIPGSFIYLNQRIAMMLYLKTVPGQSNTVPVTSSLRIENLNTSISEMLGIKVITVPSHRFQSGAFLPYINPIVKKDPYSYAYENSTINTDNTKELGWMIVLDPNIMYGSYLSLDTKYISSANNQQNGLSRFVERWWMFATNPPKTAAALYVTEHNSGTMWYNPANTFGTRAADVQYLRYPINPPSATGKTTITLDPTKVTVTAIPATMNPQQYNITQAGMWRYSFQAAAITINANSIATAIPDDYPAIMMIAENDNKNLAVVGVFKGTTSGIENVGEVNRPLAQRKLFTEAPIIAFPRLGTTGSVFQNTAAFTVDVPAIPYTDSSTVNPTKYRIILQVNGEYCWTTIDLMPLPAPSVTLQSSGKPINLKNTPEYIALMENSQANQDKSIQIINTLNDKVNDLTEKIKVLEDIRVNESVKK